MTGEGKHDGIDRPAIEALIDRFYGKVRSDPRLGPIFERAIAPAAWPTHLRTMVDFWSSVMLASGSYKGNPLAAHQKLLPALTPDLFARWLALFGETAVELFVPALAEQFRATAARIAESLMLGLFFRPGDLGGRPTRPAAATAPPPG
jgi:hemoglobin